MEKIKKEIKGKRVNKENKKNIKLKQNIMRISIIILMILVIVLIIVNVTKKINSNLDNTYECSELEKMKLQDFVNQENVTILTNGLDKNEAEVSYVLNKYLQSTPQVIMQDDAIKIYKDSFEDDNDEVESRILDILNSSNIERYKSYNQNNIFKNVTAIKKIDDITYDLYIDTVGDIDSSKLLDNIKTSGVKMNADILNINPNNEYSEENNNKLLKYVSKDNYQDVAMKVHKMKLRIKVKNEKIIIVDFENLDEKAI